MKPFLKQAYLDLAILLLDFVLHITNIHFEISEHFFINLAAFSDMVVINTVCWFKQLKELSLKGMFVLEQVILL